MPTFELCASGKKAFFLARPPADVREDIHVWIEFVKPYIHEDSLLETVFWKGSILKAAERMDICRSTDNMESLHINWPLAGDRQAAT